MTCKPSEKEAAPDPTREIVFEDDGHGIRTPGGVRVYLPYRVAQLYGDGSLWVGEDGAWQGDSVIVVIGRTAFTLKMARRDSVWIEHQQKLSAAGAGKGRR